MGKVKGRPPSKYQAEQERLIRFAFRAIDAALRLVAWWGFSKLHHLADGTLLAMFPDGTKMHDLVVLLTGLAFFAVYFVLLIDFVWIFVRGSEPIESLMGARHDQQS